MSAALSGSWIGFNTQPPKGGWLTVFLTHGVEVFVSTHSRLKAAGPEESFRQISGTRFNTQPPKGGWVALAAKCSLMIVSTHSRLKAAGQELLSRFCQTPVSTHSRLKAAGTEK